MADMVPIWLVGAQGSGKRTIQRFLTRGGKYMMIKNESGKTFNLEPKILQEEQKMQEQHYLCVIFIYSIIDNQSFEYVKHLFPRFNAKVKVLIGTRRDEAEKREVSYEVAQKSISDCNGLWGEVGLHDERNKTQLTEQITNRLQFFLEDFEPSRQEDDHIETQNQRQNFPVSTNYLSGSENQNSGQKINRIQHNSENDENRVFLPIKSRIQALFLPGAISFTDEHYFTSIDIPADLIQILDTNRLKPTRKDILIKWKETSINQFHESQKCKIKISNTKLNDQNDNQYISNTQNESLTSMMLGNTVSTARNNENHITAHAINRSQLLNEIFNGNECDFILSLQIKEREIQIGVRYTDNAYQLAKDFGAAQHLSQAEINKISVLILENIQNRMAETMAVTKGKQAQQKLNNMSFNKSMDDKKRGRKLIFQLELEINGLVYIIPFKEGDTPEGLAARICETMGLDITEYQQSFIQKIDSSYNQYLKYHQTTY